MEFAEQPIKDLQQKVQELLKQIDHHGSTVPPRDFPILNKETTDWIEEKTHDTVHLAQTTIDTSDSAKIRIAKKTPVPIAMGRWLKKKLFKEAA